MCTKKLGDYHVKRAVISGLHPLTGKLVRSTFSYWISAGIWKKYRDHPDSSKNTYKTRLAYPRVHPKLGDYGFFLFFFPPYTLTACTVWDNRSFRHSFRRPYKVFVTSLDCKAVCECSVQKMI